MKRWSPYPGLQVLASKSNTSSIVSHPFLSTWYLNKKSPNSFTVITVAIIMIINRCQCSTTPDWHQHPLGNKHHSFQMYRNIFIFLWFADITSKLLISSLLSAANSQSSGLCIRERNQFNIRWHLKSNLCQLIQRKVHDFGYLKQRCGYRDLYRCFIEDAPNIFLFSRRCLPSGRCLNMHWVGLESFESVRLNTCLSIISDGFQKLVVPVPQGHFLWLFELFNFDLHCLPCF